ncbi:unnamed protein product [Polarella glacialis]|nr:unnamed protein product [Polarella glacialis]
MATPGWAGRTMLLLMSCELVCLTVSAPPTVTLRNGVKMPLLAAGCWQYNSSTAFDSVSAAFSVGINMVDTALDYGNQDGVGRALASFPRDQIFVETKVPGCGLDKSTLNLLDCYKDTQKNLESDLSLLNVSYVDLVIVHFPPVTSFVTRSCNNWSGGCEMVRAQWKAMEEFYKQGKARAIGVSNYCPSCYDCLKSADIFPMVNQIQFHLGMGTDPAGFVSYHKKMGVQLQAYSVLGNNPIKHSASEEILRGNLTTSIGKSHNKSSVQVALKWVVDQGIPAVTKSANAKHLKEDLDLWSWELTAAEKEALDNHRNPAGSPSFACSSETASEFVV